MSPISPAPGAPRSKHRLVLCLDGTWNDRDDCTNVYHLANLVRDGEVLSAGEQVVQRVHYQAGVGTGPLDKLTGGGFGFGLEEHVREAYDWLIEKYEPGDEIFVFGFSRGAYTARSLVGFISRCGLLVRGAPLTVNQLWKGYGILGRNQEQRVGWWEELAGREEPPFRALNELVFDDGRPRPGVTRNPTEALLVQYSRRVPIRFLGVFDTVGAVGWDALAIPGLRSRLALQHNLRTTKLVERCYHALAIDEHRSSFTHTPLVEYRDGDDAHWEVERQGWEERVQQRWFVGAHSSIGGGYPDNALAQRVLRWMIEGANAPGRAGRPPFRLEVEELDAPPEPRDTGPDSYAEFAAPLWEHILRGKRSYRAIGPALEVRKARLHPRSFSLRSIGENVDASVETFAKGHPDYAPPALVAHARAHAAELPTLAARAATCAHRWLDEKPLGHLLLAVWATIAASGTFVLARIFALHAPVELFGALAAGWVLVDWGESRLGFSLALEPDRPRARALLDALFWLRAVGVVAFLAGFCAVAGGLLHLGWETRGFEALLTQLGEGWSIPLAASLTVVLLAWAGGRRGAQPAVPLLALASIPVLGILAWLAVLAAQLASIAFQHAPAGAPSDSTPAAHAALAGGCLLLQLAALALARGFDWVGTPLERVNLGSIAVFQVRPRTTLALWRARLTLALGAPQDAGPGPATRRVARVLREALWRDTFGFVPLYTLVFALAAGFATKNLGPAWAWLARPIAPPIELWHVLLAFTTVLDLVENALHLGHARRFESGRPLAPALVALGVACSVVKNAGFVLGVALLVSVLGHASWTVARDASGWRATLAVLGTYALVPVLVLWLASLGAALLRSRARTRAPAKASVRPPPQPAG